ARAGAIVVKVDRVRIDDVVFIPAVGAAELDIAIVAPAIEPAAKGTVQPAQGAVIVDFDPSTRMIGNCGRADEPRAGPSGGEGIAEARRHRVEVAGEACQIVELTVALRFGLALVVKQLDADFEIVAQLVSPV